MINNLVIFAKYPLKGKVKTRLARDVGNETALEIYRFLLSRTIEISVNTQQRVWMFYTPTCYKNEIINFVNNRSIRLLPQTGEDLGERMYNALCMVSGHNTGSCLIIGADCFEISEYVLHNTFEMLNRKEADVVIGPTFDGGYYLIGMNECNQSIFSNIDWGTEKVLGQTLNNINRTGFEYHMLDYLRDVDVIDDLSPDLINKVSMKNPGFIF